MSSRRNAFRFSGYSACLLALACLVPVAPLGGCGGDDSGAAADSGVDSPVEGMPDSGAHPDAASKDSGSSTVDSGGENMKDGSVEAAADTGTVQGQDSGADTGSTQEQDSGADTGTTQGGGDAGGADGGTDAESDAGGGNEDASVPTGAIAIWHFDEGSGSSAFDSSGNSHTATLVNGATFATGKHGTGLSPNASGWAVVPATAPDSGVVDSGASADAGEDGGAVDASASDGGAADSGAADDASFDGSNGDDAGDASIASTFLPLTFDTTKSFTIGCWVKVYAKGANDWESAFSKSGQNLAVFTLKLRGDSPVPAGGESFDFDFPGADNTGTGIYTVAASLTSPTVSASNGSTSYWYHLVGVLDVETGATTVTIYVNGVREAFTSPGTAPILEGTGDTIIGASLFGGIGASWNGVIDEMYLYDRPLSAADVTALYLATK